MAKQRININPAKPVTLQQIADRCGLHVSTVSLALRGVTQRVNADTMAFVKATAHDMGYDPEATHFARRLRLGHTEQRPHSKMVAVFTSDSFATAKYFFTMFHAILTTLSSQGYSVCTALSSRKGLHPLPNVFARGDIDGVITMDFPDKFIKAYSIYSNKRTIHFPVVSLIHSHPGIATVMADDRAGAFATASYLLKLGHRHILHFHADAATNVHRNRSAGYRDAYLALDLDPAAYLHYCTEWSPYQHDDNARDWVWKQLKPSLERHPQITAILTQSDFVAVQVYEALQLAGIRVPEDISLVGFDDTHVIHKGNSENILTTVRVPLYEMGGEAAYLCLRIINGEAPPDQQRVFPVEFVERKSCRPISPLVH